jgi:recombination protein RecA
VLARINSEFGTGSVMVMGTDERAPVEVISTGSIALNEALGVGGLARGRIFELYGPESSGKTSIALHAAANAQRAGGRVAFVDAEHSLDPDWARTLGVDVGDGMGYEAPAGPMLISQPDTGEQGLEITDRLVCSGKMSMIIVDSVSALVPKAEIEGQMGDTHVGLQARMMSQALRKLAGHCNTNKTTLVFINQLREKVGVFFGSPETTSGGKALKFYATVRLDVRRIETLKDGTEAIGNKVRVKVVKNKMARPFQVAEFDFLYTCGISEAGELLDLGFARKVLTKSGSWYVFDGSKLGNGREASRQALMKDAGLADAIRLRVYAAGSEGAEPPAESPDKDAAPEDAPEDAPWGTDEAARPGQAVLTG